MPREQKLQQITRYAECFRPWVLNPADNYGNGVASAHLMAEILKGRGQIGLIYRAPVSLKPRGPKNQKFPGAKCVCSGKRRRDIGMFPESFCERSLSAAVQSEFS
jgi:hypothetical protein